MKSPRQNDVLWACALHMAIVLSMTCTSAAFTLHPVSRSSDLRQDAAVYRPLRPGTSSFASADDESTPADDDAPAVEYPALSEDEIQNLLDAIPIYGVTGAKKEGLVLLRERGNENELAYFFFSPDIANSVYAPLRANNIDGIGWDVTRFPLGFVWFELLKNPASPADDAVSDGIEYRLVPDSRELAGARSILQTTQQMSGAKAGQVPDIFKKSYNEIPIFMDQFLRLEGDDGDKVPMYFGLQDLIKTCQQAVDGDGQYQASINIADLHSIVRQMQETSTVDFRQAAMIPPTPLPVEEVKTDIKPEQKPAEIELPTATDMWSD
jgi:hypothetical protein